MAICICTVAVDQCFSEWEFSSDLSLTVCSANTHCQICVQLSSRSRLCYQDHVFKVKVLLGLRIINFTYNLILIWKSIILCNPSCHEICISLTTLTLKRVLNSLLEWWGKRLFWAGIDHSLHLRANTNRFCLCVCVCARAHVCVYVGWGVCFPFLQLEWKLKRLSWRSYIGEGISNREKPQFI